MFLRIMGAVVGLVVMLPSAAEAVTYSYLGDFYNFINDETLPTGTFDTTMRLQGSFSVDNALTDSTNYDDVTTLAGFSFHFNNGRNDFYTDDVSVFSLMTDASGDIDYAYITAYYNISGGGIQLGDQDASMLVVGGTGEGALIECTTQDSPGICDGRSSDYGTFDRGSWSQTSVVPIPPALSLFGSGLALMGFFGWRRKRKTASIA